MNQSHGEQPLQRGSFLAIVVRYFFTALGGLGAVLILYSAISQWTGEVWQPLERLAPWLSSLLTLLATLVTALSVYFYSPYPTKPERISIYVTAPLVVIGSTIAIISLLLQTNISPVIVNGFALMAIAGALLRIQTRPFID